MTPEGGHQRAERFDFELARNTGVIICQQVRDGAPILHVSHDGDGDWQFLCGGDHGDDSPDRGLLRCLECLVAADPSLNELADLGCNWSANREVVGARWTRHDHLEDEIREAVERTGWFVLAISGEGDLPPFAYTIGLHRSYGHAELIVLGLEPETMHAMLDTCGERIKKGERLAVGVPVAEIISGYDVRFRQVMTRASYTEHVGYGLWFNDGPNFPLLQLLWPDKEGRFPGEDGAAAYLAAEQPLLP